MLVLQRRVGEEFVIDGNVIVRVVKVRNNRVFLGIRAPKGVRVDRSEVSLRKKAGMDVPGKTSLA